MTFKNSFATLLFVTASLSSCSKTPLQEVQYLNKQDCAILVFKDNISKEDLGFSDNVSFEVVSSLSPTPETNRKYTLLLIDCSKHYSLMTKEAVESIYHWVHDANCFRMASWYDAKDYSFLEDEPYYYWSMDEEVPVCYSHYKFDDREGKMTGRSNVGGVVNPLSAFSKAIKDYVEQLY